MADTGTHVGAVVFDLFNTLVHPGRYPGGTGRVGWLAAVLGIDAAALRSRWEVFEPVLEAGRAPAPAGGLDPELAWVRDEATDLGTVPTEAQLTLIHADWDRTRRQALLDPAPAAVATLTALRGRGIRLGLLSNTHALEIRAWDRSPIAPLFDVVAFSHRIGACKPDPRTYEYALGRLRLPAPEAAYVGDGGNDDLAGARAAGFGTVILTEETPARRLRHDLPRLRAQADTSVTSLAQIPALLGS